MSTQTSKRVLLAALAHPDDESFGIGGTLALYAQRGVEVHLICATRGEAGEVDADCLEGFETIAARREYELRCAASKLGLAGVYFLDYRDSGMKGWPDNTHPNALIMAPLEEVAGKIVHWMRKLKPQVVITFDPIGGYYHPDHIHIHQATVLAFQASGDPEAYPENPGPYAPQRLYFQTINRSFIRLTVRLLRLLGRDPRKWGRNGDIDLAALADVSFPTHAEVDFRPVATLRAEAAACHDSQGGQSMSKGFQGWFLNRFRSRESFMRSWPEPVNGEPLEKDLFANIR